MRSSRASDKLSSLIAHGNRDNRDDNSIAVDSQKNKDLRSLIEKTFIENTGGGSISNRPPSKIIEKPVLSHSALVEMPGLLDNIPENIILKNLFPKNLAHTIFKNLKEKTKELLSLWKIITPATQRLISTVPDDQARNAIVLQRFNDVPLIDNGAIEDTLRSKRYGVKQFLHANLMDFSGGLQFIASQKPHNNAIENEIPGFWSMILQRKVPLIVDLTKPEEHKSEDDYSFGKVRNSGSQKCGPLTITPPENKATASARNRLARASGQISAQEKTFSISDGNALHEVKRIHFKDWPDQQSIPPDTLITLADKIEAASEGSNAPVLIHCRAGVGRTGTLMSFIVARKLIANELEQVKRPVTIAMIGRTLLHVVAEGRLGRGPQFVQTKEQFHSAANALALHFSRESEASPQSSPSGRNAGQQQSASLRRALGSEQPEIKDKPLTNKGAPSLAAAKHAGLGRRPKIPLLPIAEEGINDMGSAKIASGTIHPVRSTDVADAQSAINQLPSSENLSNSSTKDSAAAAAHTDADDNNNVANTPNDIVNDAVIDAEVADSGAVNSAAAHLDIAVTDSANINTASTNSAVPDDIRQEGIAPHLVHTSDVNIAIASGNPQSANPLNASEPKANTGNSSDPVDSQRPVSDFDTVAQLWNTLSRAVAESLPALNDDTIEQEVTHLPCIAETAVSVLINDERKYIHANRVRVTQLPTNAQPDPAPHHYIAGQSPQRFATCEKLLLKAIESREGIFQLVSPATHNRLQGDCAGEEKKLSVAPILMQLLAKCARGEEIIIDNRFRVIPTKRENTPDHIASYDLTIQTRTGDEVCTLPITQIGLNFDNAVLKAEDIKAANVALDNHLRHGIASNAESGTEPIIISRKGVGRNATLIVYHEILPWIRSGQITNKAHLDAALERVIVAGRRARSPHFVHSAKQLQELRNALISEMAELQTDHI